MYLMMGMVNNCSVHSGMITSHGAVSQLGVTTFYAGTVDGKARAVSTRAVPLLTLLRDDSAFACSVQFELQLCIIITCEGTVFVAGDSARLRNRGSLNCNIATELKHFEILFYDVKGRY